MKALLFLSLTSIVFVFGRTGITAADETQELRSALQALDTELAQDVERRERWRELLRTDELEDLMKMEPSEIEARDVETIRRLYLLTEAPPNEQLLNDARDAVSDWTANVESDQAAQLLDQADDAVGDLYRSFSGRTARRLWDPILGMNDMLSEFLRGEDADQGLIRDRLNRLVVEAAHFDRTRFVAVRRALGRWATAISEPVTDPLAIAARQAKGTFRPVEQWRADQSLSDLRQRLQRLDRYLLQGEDWKRSGWESFLKLEKLDLEIRHPRDVRLSDLRRVLDQFDSGELGLQRPAFRNTRDALQEYIELLRMAEGTAARVLESRERLETALNLLDRFLARGGPSKESGWKKFLEWDKLSAELGKPNPDLRELRRIERLFESDEPGLETLPFRLAVRRLGKYIELRLMERSATQPIDIFDDKLDKLARYLEAYGEQPTAITAADISLQTKWLAATGQAPELVQRIASRYSRNNVFGSISGDLVEDRVRDELTDQTPINREFEGARIRGTAFTRGQVRGQLIPSLDSAILDILLTGTTNTTTVGQQKRVSIYASGTTWLSGRKRLIFDLKNGVRSLPATAAASTSQQIKGVHFDRKLGRRLVEKIATRKAWESVPKAKSLANQEARQTITRQMDEQALPLLAEANQQLEDKVKTPLREQGFRPEMFRLSSSSSHVELNARLTPHDYYGAPVEPPLWNRDHDVAVCCHESALNNSLAGYFGGIRIDNENIIKILETYKLEIPEELQSGAEEDEPEEVWSMTFDLHHPISISIGVNRIHVRVMGMEFVQGDTKVNERIRVGASYQVHWKPKQLPELERDGDVNIEFIDSPGRLSTKQLTTKTFLQRKVGSLFKNKIDLSDIDTGEATELLQSVTLKRASLLNGWFAAALDVDADALPRRR